MSEASKPKLTAGEMEMMSLLWAHDQLTIAGAHEALDRPLGYTTVQTRLNRLVEKGLVERSTERPAQYRAAVTPEDISANHLEVLLDRVTGGSVVPLVAHLVADRSVTREELSELKQLILEAEQRLGQPQEDEHE